MFFSDANSSRHGRAKAPAEPANRLGRSLALPGQALPQRRDTVDSRISRPGRSPVRLDCVTRGPCTSAGARSPAPCPPRRVTTSPGTEIGQGNFPGLGAHTVAVTRDHLLELGGRRVAALPARSATRPLTRSLSPSPSGRRPPWQTKARQDRQQDHQRIDNRLPNRTAAMVRFLGNAVEAECFRRRAASTSVRPSFEVSSRTQHARNITVSACTRAGATGSSIPFAFAWRPRYFGR